MLPFLEWLRAVLAALLIKNELQRVYRTVSPSRGSAYPSNEPSQLIATPLALAPPTRLRLASIRFIRDYEYRGLMEEADREVLEFIGDQGKTAEQVSDRFPAYDLERLVRAELARSRRTNPVKAQSRHTSPALEHTFYVLTSRGAEAIGLAPHTLHSD